ncbi:hypothetical protein [Escherichia sp. TW14182]
MSAHFSCQNRKITLANLSEIIPRRAAELK